MLVHRDYHSRNLLVRPEGNPGIVDFQDAVRGPISYDLVSLLKDCYVVWPRTQLLAWLDRYREKAAAAGLDAGRDRDEFLRWFDRMGLQRHLKVLGIFARLWHRDGKPGYLGDLPRVLDYTLEVDGGTAGARRLRRVPAARRRAGLRDAVPPRGSRALKAMILAAGRGERMRPLTEKLPKPLLEVGGHRLIEYHLASLVDLGVRDVVINLSWHGDRIREALGDGAAHGLSIRYSDEGPEPLGTGGGIAAALPLLGAEPFIVLNGDVWTDFPLRSLSARRDRSRTSCWSTTPSTTRTATTRSKRAAASATARRSSRSPASRCSIPRCSTGGAPGFLALKPLLDAALAAGRLTGQRHGGAWRDVGTPARLAALDAELRLGKARHPVLSSPVG